MPALAGPGSNDQINYVLKIISFYVYTGLDVSQYSGISSNKFANKYLQIESSWCNSSNKHHERIMFKMSSCKHLTHKSPL